MYNDNSIILDGVLQGKINNCMNVKRKKIKMQYPYILCGARMGKFIKKNERITINIKDTLPIISSKYKIFGNGCYIRKGVLPPINAYNAELTEQEILYLKYNNFEPIC